MRCPDWPTLVARRDRDPEGELHWERALQHLDGCEPCREAAYAAEPTLIFRRLPAPEPTEQDVAAMRESVAAMRRAQPLVVPAAARRLSSRWRRRRMGTLHQAAATVALLVTATLLYTLAVADGNNRALPLVPETGSPVAAPAMKPVAEPTAAEPATVEPATVEPAVIETTTTEVPAAFTGVRDGLRVDIQVMRASKKAQGNIPRYDSYQVLAEAGVTSREGEDVTLTLGESFAVSFKTGTVLEDDRLLLEDFQIETQAPAVKGPQLEPQRLLNAHLTLRLDRPITLVLAQDPAEEEALVVAITYRQERSSGP